MSSGQKATPINRDQFWHQEFKVINQKFLQDFEIDIA